MCVIDLELISVGVVVVVVVDWLVVLEVMLVGLYTSTSHCCGLLERFVLMILFQTREAGFCSSIR